MVTIWNISGQYHFDYDIQWLLKDIEKKSNQKLRTVCVKVSLVLELKVYQLLLLVLLEL